ncbi:MAG: LuxR C-terminal-related transcriptional regulator [Microthrixaceae bacterium]
MSGSVSGAEARRASPLASPPRSAGSSPSCPRGCTNRQIADEMFLAEKTVKNYVSNLLAKMGMSRRTEAAVYAARLAGAVPPRALRVTNGSVAGRHGVPRSLHG